MASLTAQRSELETRSQGLEIRKQELDKLSETLQGWREQLQEAASKQAVAELEKVKPSIVVLSGPFPPSEAR